MAGVLATLAGAGVGAVSTALSNQQNMANQRKLMDKANKQAQDNQRNAYVNQVEGMQRAGISTALLAGGQPQTAVGAAPSAPQADYAGGMKGGSEIAFGAMEAFKQLALMNSEKDLMEANAHNSEANAVYTEGAKTENTEVDASLKQQQETNLANQNVYQSIINQRENDKDASVAKTLLKNYPDLCAQVMEKHGWSEDDFVENASLGMLEGMVAGLRGKADAQNAVLDYSLATIKNSPIYLNAIRDKPASEIDLIDGTLDKMTHEKTFLDSLAVLNAHNANLADTKVQEALQNIENLKQSVLESKSRQQHISQDIEESKTRQNLYRTGMFKNVTSGLGDIVDGVVDVATAGKFGSLKKSTGKPNVKFDASGTPHPPNKPFRSFDELGDYKAWYDSKGGIHKSYRNPATGKYE